MQTAVVTGANRGIGREVARQLAADGWRVFVTGRRADAIEAAAQEIAAETGGEVEGRVVDVSDTDAVVAFAKGLAEDVEAVHCLVNNAGHIFDGETGEGLEGEVEAVRRSVETNTLSALRMARALTPLLKAGQANVVQVSTGMAGLTEMGGGTTGYRLSKVAMNAVTRILHSELSGAGLRVNSVCPGWVQTDMGGPRATRTVAEGAASVLWAATLGPDGPSGGSFRDGQRLDW